jgi:hypothetical protein
MESNQLLGHTAWALPLPGCSKTEELALFIRNAPPATPWSTRKVARLTAEAVIPKNHIRA